MKKLTLLILVAFAALILILITKGDTLMKNTIKNETLKDGSFIGATDLQNVTLREISILGSLKFQDIKVTGDTDIKGSVTGENGDFQDVSIWGSVEMRNSTCQRLHVSAEEVILENTVIEGNLIIEPTLKSKALKWIKESPEQMLHLKGKTFIKGDVIFVSGNGKIIKEESVEINGEIQNTK